MGSDLFSFPIDIKTTLKHLRQDMKDDWFYDAVRYEDLLSNYKEVERILSENLDLNHGKYETGHKAIYDVPKRSLGLRYTLELDFYDRFLYQAICTYLIKYFDPLLSNRVLSHRYEKFGNSRYLFKHRIELWNTFEKTSFYAFQDDKSLLITDLLNYFEQISVDVIESSFIGMIGNIEASGGEKNTIREAISKLRAFLEKWCYNDRHGLPQNRDASSFIGNVVLDSVDKAMVQKGYDYFRYVDDIRIICSDTHEAKRALNDLIFELRKLGLNINSKKTVILDKNSKDIEDYFPSTNETMTLIDSMWRSKSKKVIARSIPILYDFFKEQIDKEETQSRPFRYCINRFKILISSNLFESKSILAQDIADLLINELEKQPVSTDQFCKLLKDLDLSEAQLSRIADYLVDEMIAIHCWQNYQLLLLMAEKQYSYQPLIDFCKKLISQDITRAEVPACFIYLASIGRQRELETFIKQYESTWPYQHQRYFLIALQSADVKTIRPLFGKVNYRLKGTVARLKSSKLFKGETVYIKDFNQTMITDIYDEISPYE